MRIARGEEFWTYVLEHLAEVVARPAVLTSGGDDLVARAQKVVAGVEAQMLSGLGAEETDALRVGLASCIAALDPDANV